MKRNYGYLLLSLILFSCGSGNEQSAVGDTPAAAMENVDTPGEVSSSSGQASQGFATDEGIIRSAGVMKNSYSTQGTVGDEGVATFLNRGNVIENAIKKYLYEEHVNLEKKEIVVNEDMELNTDGNNFKYKILKRRVGFVSDYDGAPEYLETRLEMNGTWKPVKYANDSIYVFVTCEIKYGSQYETAYEPGYSEYNDVYEGEKVLVILTGQNTETEVALNQTGSVSMYQIGTQRLFTINDLDAYKDSELAFLRNEFYARKGFKFKTERMQKYFGEMDWYNPQFEDVTDKLSKTELDNVYFIKSIEEARKISVSADRSELISGIYKTGTARLLTASDLDGLSPHQLAFLRNEFFARHGYIFSSKKYNTYFGAKKWYKPQYKEVLSMLSETEKKNVEFISKHEEALK